MADHLDALLELTPAKKMRSKFSGEAQDSAHQGSARSARIEITFFRFGNAKSLAKAKEQRDKDKLEESKKEQLEEHEEDANENERAARQRPTKLSGNKEQDYRFQITKQIDKASPILMQAYFSNSFKPKRQESNSFDEAKLVVRKLGGGGSKSHKVYLTLTFRGVYIVGYEVETMGKEPPQETIDFCFQSCEMSYARQLKSGEVAKNPKIKGWNFVSQQEVTTR
jgi:type VI protein secretion system component Hcp